MAHEIEQLEDGSYSMVYTGEVPWHGLGTEVSPDMTPIQMMKAAHLDWKVEKRPLFYRDEKGNEFEAEDKRVLVRSSDNKFMDVVGKGWKPVQNRDAFEFFTKYVEAGGIQMHTAGSLQDGKIIWGLAKINEEFELFGGDLIEGYLLLSNPHKFGKGVDIRGTNIRVVCNNTLTAALSKETSVGLSLNHRANFDVKKVQQAVEESREQLLKYKEMAEFLGSKRFTKESIYEYFDTVFPVTTPEKEKTNVISLADAKKDKGKAKRGAPKRERSRNAVLAIEVVEKQPGHEFAEGTFWSAYNAVSYMTDHHLGRSTDTRLESAWYGANARKKVLALQTAIDMAKAA